MPEVRPFVIAVGGIPGSGKTTLAARLGVALHVPVLVRDTIKEGLHVTARSDDPADVRRFSGRAFDLFWATVRALSGAGVSLVAEAAFHRSWATDDFRATAEAADLLLVWCRVDRETALARYRARAPLRHPAHADVLMAERMNHPAFDWSVYDPPRGPWPIVEVDTSEPDTAPGIPELCRHVDELRTGRS